MNYVRMTAIAKSQQHTTLIQKLLISIILLAMSYGGIQNAYGAYVALMVVAHLIDCRVTTLS